jgi:hypothetical protein
MNFYHYSSTLLVSVALTNAMMYDVIEPASSPPTICTLGCAKWTDLASDYNTASQTDVNTLWFSEDKQSLAGSFCAMPANFNGAPGLVSPTGPLDFDFSFGPQCYCKGSSSQPSNQFGYCLDPPTPTPQQINLQYGKDETELTVAFVTVDFDAPLTRAPLAELCLDTNCVNVTGFTNRFAETQNKNRVLSFHFVTFPAPLKSASTYTYRVRGGTDNSVWSSFLKMRTRATNGSTKFAMAGDLGIYPYNCMQNRLDDESIPFFVHLADHAYNMEMGGGARGDAYMMGWQPVLSQIPMISSIGNHGPLLELINTLHSLSCL